MFPKISLLIACLVFAHGLQGEELNVVMNQLGEKMLVILPGLYSDDVSVDKLKSDALELATLLKEAESHLGDADPGTRVTYNMLQDQLSQATRFSTHSNPNMLKSDLAESFALCASCHNQDRKFVRNYGISKFRDMDEFLAAEYGYLTRDYDSALTSYRNFIKDKADESAADQDTSRQVQKDELKKIQTALDRMLVITLEVYREPKLAFDVFTENRKYLSKQTRFTQEIDDWLEVFQRLIEEPKSSHSPIGITSIEAMDHYLAEEWPVVQSVLDYNAQLAYWIAIRGQLNHLMRIYPEDAQTPRLLYWLALSDRALQYRFYDSLSRRYLVSCIRDYPEHEIAEECFKEYEMLMIVSFSGSGGVYLPDEAQQEIGELRRLVYADRQSD